MTTHLHHPLSPKHSRHPGAERAPGLARAVGVRAVAVLGVCAMLAAGIPAREPVLRIRAQASFDETGPVRAGDTVTYRLRVEWNEFPAAVMIGPRDAQEALDAPGFARAGSSVEHARARVDGALINRTDFIYRLVPREEGPARVAASPLRYHNGLTGREEELPVPAATLSVLPAAAPWRGAGIAVLAGGILMAGLGLLALRRARKRPEALTVRPPEALPEALPDAPEAAAIDRLRARCEAADGTRWVRDAERLCIVWLSRKLGVTNTDQVRFDAALDQYLNRNPGLSLAARRGWTTLRDLFHEARYAGAPPEPYRLREACHHLANCLSRHATLGDQTP